MTGFRSLVLGFCSVILLASCKSGPSFEAPAPLEPVSVPVPETPDSPLIAETPDETVLLVPPESSGSEVLIEPELNLAESDTVLIPPPETPLVLSEPKLVQPEAPVPIPPVQPTRSVPPAQPARSAPPAQPARSAPPQPVDERRAPPKLPETVRPAETEPPSPAAKVVIPVPAAPLPDLPARIPPVESAEQLNFSRIVRATVGQLVEIPFRGTGWVYLGEQGSRRGMEYDSRRLDPEGQSFIFRTLEAGNYALKFYKEDFIRDYILNDYVQVLVGEAPDTAGAAWFNPPIDRGRVIAEPRWPELPAVPQRDTQAASGQPPEPWLEAPGALPQPPVQNPSGVQPVPGTPSAPETRAGVFPVPPGAASVPASPGLMSGVPSGTSPAGFPEAGDGILSPDTLPGEYIRRARVEYDAGRIAPALEVLDQFRERFPSGSDEAWWLYGQLLEANGPSRDIRSSLDYYRRLVREYPQSSRYDDARRRIAYLERYYINIQ